MKMPPAKNNKPSNAEVMLEVMQLVDKHKNEDKEDRRLIYDKLNKNSEVIAEMLPKLISCHKDLNGNGQPGLKKTVERHVSVQKWITGVVTAILGGGATLVIANWNIYLAKIYTLMKILEWWSKNHQ